MIEMSLDADVIFDGDFELFSEDDRDLKGAIFSTNERVILLNNQFTQKKNRIRFRVITEFLDAQDIISGVFQIVSNGGEIEIPYKINIESVGIMTGIGLIKNLEDFLCVVKQNYDEGLKIFCGEEFGNGILKNSPRYRRVYYSLIKSPDRERALEEFLVFTGQKERVVLSLSSYGAEYRELEDSYGDCLVIKKEHWGFAEVEVEVKGDFIRTAKNQISSDMFVGNSYELNYYINYNKLIAGENKGKIIFKTHNQSLEYMVTVIIPKRKKYTSQNFRRNRGILAQKYMEYLWIKRKLFHGVMSRLIF
jgi:hypothetical protein